MNRASFSILFLTAFIATACNDSSSNTPGTSTSANTAGHSSVTAAGSHASGPAGSVATAPSGAAGMTSKPTTPAGGAGASATGAAGMTTPPANAGSGGAAPAAGSGGGSATAGAGGMMAAAGGATGAAGGGAANASMVTGTLGALGAAQPVMAGWATTNGLETLVYLSTAPLTCAMMMTQGVKWLSKLPAKSQVIEIVVGNPSSAKTYMIGQSAALGGGEVNYAEGSKSSSTEVTGKTGKITFTKGGAMAVQEGTFEVSAPQMFSGTFHAEWCQGGTEY